MSGRRITATTALVLDLGLVTVDFGRKDDQERLGKMIGSLPCHFDLDPVHFLHLDEWPEGKIEDRLLIVRFPGKDYPNIKAVNERLDAEGLILKGFPHLTTAMKIDGALDRFSGNQYAKVAATDPLYYYESSYKGDFSAVEFSPYHRHIGLNTMGVKFKASCLSSWLVGEKS